SPRTDRQKTISGFNSELTGQPEVPAMQRMLDHEKTSVARTAPGVGGGTGLGHSSGPGGQGAVDDQRRSERPRDRGSQARNQAASTASRHAHRTRSEGQSNRSQARGAG